MKICPKCQKNPIPDYREMCRSCEYVQKVVEMSKLPYDLQEWEFTHCEECGSSLGSDGLCHNTWCGNSPDQGTDWV